MKFKWEGDFWKQKADQFYSASLMLNCIEIITSTKPHSVYKHYVYFRPFVHSTFCSLSTFCSFDLLSTFDLLSIRPFVHSTFCPLSTFCPFDLMSFDLLSIRPYVLRPCVLQPSFVCCPSWRLSRSVTIHISNVCNCFAFVLYVKIMFVW